jgi:hypothetical protein
MISSSCLPTANSLWMIFVLTSFPPSIESALLISREIIRSSSYQALKGLLCASLLSGWIPNGAIVLSSLTSRVSSCARMAERDQDQVSLMALHTAFTNLSFGTPVYWFARASARAVRWGASVHTNVGHATNTNQRQFRFVLHVSGPKMWDSCCHAKAYVQSAGVLTHIDR